MAKYRKKPVVIEAFKYDGDLMNSKGEYYIPDWAVEAYTRGDMYFDSFESTSPPTELFIKTLEGIHHASVGDYIIKGVKGEFYPCKPDIFEQTYELADKEVLETAKVVVDTINKMQNRALACSSVLNT